MLNVNNSYLKYVSMLIFSEEYDIKPQPLTERLLKTFSKNSGLNIDVIFPIWLIINCLEIKNASKKTINVMQMSYLTHDLSAVLCI